LSRPLGRGGLCRRQVAAVRQRLIMVAARLRWGGKRETGSGSLVAPRYAHATPTQVAATAGLLHPVQQVQQVRLEMPTGRLRVASGAARCSCTARSSTRPRLPPLVRAPPLTPSMAKLK
jgi:hypothetical protein